MNRFFTLLCSVLICSSTWAGSFGRPGQNGSTGNSGHYGGNGDDVTIFAPNAQGGRYNLNGGDGGDGHPGADGGDAYFCSQDRVAEDLFGANAGDGGAGGDGGSGGHGGDATIYYTDISQLKKILIISEGGEGGRGSYGGRGGSRGCRCDYRNWEMPPRCYDYTDKDGKLCRRCDPPPRFTCDDGHSGRDGSRGSDGNDGSSGSVTLIKSATALLEENSDASVAVNKLNTNQTVRAVLTENLFTSKAGIRSFLAPGSRVNDNYYEFVRRAVENVAIVWQAPRKPADHTGKVSAFIRNGKVGFEVSSNDILITERSDSAAEHTLTIKEAYKVDEFSRIGITKEGLGKNSKIKVQAISPRPDMVTDSFHVTITYVRLILRDKVVFSGPVPKQFISKSGNQTILNIGQIKFEDSDKIWNKKLVINFSFNRKIANSYENISKSATYKQDKL
ncbi:hypothetical protein [Bdellovibrio sp. HCB288]|uniref:hypothetical protein n=1 Tax=Bdellovibrio sp. HCB288 TaxID=3394355 RepID=UPI0039B3E554